MTDHDRRAGEQHAHARVEKNWWPGWIWALPIAVLLIVGWLALRSLTNGGKDITIRFDDVHGLSANSASVQYRGMDVGKVSGIKLAKDGQSVLVKANIDQAAAQFLRSGTIFWLKGANPDLGNLSSLGSVLSGPTIMMEPGPGQQASVFQGSTDKPVAAVGHGRPQPYVISFDGPVGSLKHGDPVKLRGFTVGEVQWVGFEFDMATGALATPVVIDLYPSLFHIGGQTDDERLAALRQLVTAMVGHGLRAELGQSPPLIGGYAVTLEMVPNAPAPKPVMAGSVMAPATPGETSVPQLPSAPAGGLGGIANKIGALPIDQIAHNILDVTRRADMVMANANQVMRSADGVIGSPKLKDSIDQLDATLRQVHQTAAVAGPQVTQLIGQLRGTADQIDQTARAAHKLVGGPATQTGVTDSLDEITGAARALRELADYLTRHPEALIKGRKD